MKRDDDDGLIVDLHDDRQLSLLDEPRKPDPKTSPEAKKPDVVVVQDRSDERDEVADLKAKLAARDEELNRERAQRQTVETESRRHQETALSARDAAAQRAYDLANTNIEHAKQREATIKRDLRLALEMGDSERAVELQMEAASLAAKRLKVEDEAVTIKARYDAEQAARKAAPKPEADSFEQQIAGVSDARTRDWLRNHRECITDPVKNAQALYADKLALSKGLRGGTDEYFAFVEEHMGYRQRDDDADVEVRQPARQEQRRSMPAAPVSRDGAHNGAPTRPSQVRLSREEVAMAEQLGMTPEKYARNKIAAKDYYGKGN